MSDRRSLRFLISLLFTVLPLFAQDAIRKDGNPTAENTDKDKQTVTANKDNVPPAPQAVLNERVSVVGSVEAAERTAGSAHYIGQIELKKYQYDDIHRILRTVPGVNIQEEDGLGLRPNIGIRGTGVERSSKITLMEDGVLIAPAPYTAPAAYYFPTAGRMEGIEVLKGPSSIKQGPYSNGGSLNMLSADIPGAFNAELNGAGGSHGTKRLEAKVGNSYERYGWLVETYQLDVDGFKNLDTGGNTGVRLEDYMVKFRFNSSPTARVYQSLELKLGKTEQLGDETYLGLTEADFRRTPYRRYAASQNDQIDTDHEQIQARYFVKPAASWDVTTTVYNNDYFRNWHKAERTNGISNSAILANPGQYANEVDILRGDLNSEAGAISIRNNNRNYYSRGVQSVLRYQANTGNASHKLDVGLRYHEDEEDRLQNDESYTMVDGQLVLDTIGARGSQTNRVASAEAISFFVQDTIEMGKWTLTPGVRYENIDYTRIDYSKADPSRTTDPTRVRENAVDVFLPGTGINYAFDGNNRAFLGVHRGFSPPGAGVSDETQEEKSVNYELGYRHSSERFRFEVIGFFNDYSNLLGIETVSGGGTTETELFNGGAVEVKGLESMFSLDLTQVGSWRIPLDGSYTYTTSEFKSSFSSDFADWEPGVTAGDELPYLPENQLRVGIGATNDIWSINLSTNYVSEMRTKAGQGAIPVGQGTDDRTVLDLSLSYMAFGKYRVYAQVRNLTDEVYIVSRRPYGLRPGLDRTFLMGLSANF